MGIPTFTANLSLSIVGFIRMWYVANSKAISRTFLNINGAFRLYSLFQRNMCIRRQNTCITIMFTIVPHPL